MTKTLINNDKNFDLGGVAFDLDETLTKSKQPITAEIAKLLEQLIYKLPTAIVSGATKDRMESQVFSSLDSNSYKNLTLYPTNGAAMYVFNNSHWLETYNKLIAEVEVKRISDVIIKAVKSSGFLDNTTIWGPQIEFRGSQVTFSALGQNAPYEPKSQWDKNKKKRLYLRALIAPQLSEYDVAIGGTTSIDVVHKGVNKAYGVIKFSEHIKCAERNILYVGDDLKKGGNDYVVTTSTNVRTYSVTNPTDTQCLLKALLKN